MNELGVTAIILFHKYPFPSELYIKLLKKFMSIS